MPNIAVIYYSSTGNVHDLAQAVGEGAADRGAEVRVHRVAEQAPEEAIAANEEWKAHLEATKDVPEATLDDLEWSHGYLFGTPTRYGNVAGQLKDFIDQTAPLWQDGKLQDKPAAGFTSVTSPNGGQESTLLSLYQVFMHWGALVAAPGYTHEHQFVAGNPYGVSHWDQDGTKKPDEDTLKAARYLGGRVAGVAERIYG